MRPSNRNAIRGRRTVAIALAVGLVTAGTAIEASAQAKGKSIQTEAQWVGYDASAATVTVKVRKPGKKVKNKEAALRKGKEATFNVKPEGSVLTRTSVKINGRRGELKDIPEGKTVNLYWIIDESQSTKRFARTIDLILSDEELDERYGVE